MTETEYWNRHLKPLLAPYVYVWKISASYIKGVPDWWASGSNNDLWVENKRLTNDAKKPPAILDLTDHKKYLTIHQQEWLEGRYNEGRNVGVVVFSKIGHLWLPDLTWQKPIPALTFNEKAMPKQHLADILLRRLGGVDKLKQTGNITRWHLRLYTPVTTTILWFCAGSCWRKKRRWRLSGVLTEKTESTLRTT